VLLSASHSTRVSTLPTTSISGPDLHVDDSDLFGTNCSMMAKMADLRFVSANRIDLTLICSKISHKKIGCRHRDIRLDPHADTGALTPSVDWIMCHSSVVFSSNLPPTPIFHQSALSVKAPVSA